MEEILKALAKVSKFEDALVVGSNRVASNIALGVSVVTAVRAQNLGNDTNALCDALLEIGNKAKQILNR